MKVYKNQTEQSVKKLGLGLSANFSFASDENFSPNGIDITLCRNLDGKYTYEVTEYDKGSKTAIIRIMNTKEFSEYKKNYKPNLKS